MFPTRVLAKPTDPTMDITQQLIPLFDGDAMLQDPSVALPIELALNNDKGLGTTRKSMSSFFLLIAPYRGGSRGKASSSRLKG